MADIAEISTECDNAVGDAATVHSESPAKSTACDSVCNATETCESKKGETTEFCTKTHEAAADTTDSSCPLTGTKRKSEDVLGEHGEDLKKAKTDAAKEGERTEAEGEAVIVTDDVSNGKTEHTDDAPAAGEVESTNGKEAADDILAPEIVTKTVEDVAKLSEEVDA